MTTHFAQPLDGGVAAHAIKIAAAAQEAVKLFSQFSLGAGDIDRIISMTSHGTLSIAERINLAQNLARETAKAYLEQPRSNFDAMQQQVAQQPFGPRGLGPYDFSRVGPLAWQDGDRAGPAGNRSGVQYSQLNGASGWSDVRTMPGSGFSMLTAANQHVPGFTREQVAGAANFLHAAGVNRADINHDTRHMVHLKPYQSDIRDLIQRRKEIERRRRAGHDVTDAEREYEQERQRVRKKMTPSQQRHFDGMRSINAQNLSHAQNDPDGARKSTEQQRAEVRGDTPQAMAPTAAQNATAERNQRESGDDTLGALTSTAGIPTPARAEAPAQQATPSAQGISAPPAEPAREASNTRKDEPKPAQARAAASPTLA